MSDSAPTRRRVLAGRVRRLTVDVRPLRASRDFRLLWTGEAISQVGSQITLVALFVQVYNLTRSSIAVGAVGLVQLVPMIFVSVGFGPQIDRFDRRRILLGAQLGLMLSSVLLVDRRAPSPSAARVDLRRGRAQRGVRVDLDADPRRDDTELRDARTACARGRAQPGDVERRRRHRARARWRHRRFAVSVCDGRTASTWRSYVVAIAFALMLRPQLPNRDPDKEWVGGWSAVSAGFRFLKGRSVLQSTFTIDVVAMVFGMPRVLFPALAATQFHRGPQAVGWMFSSVGLRRARRRAHLGLGRSGSTAGPGDHRRRSPCGVPRSRRLGWWATDCGSRSACLALAGGADVISAVFRSTIQQTTIPDESARPACRRSTSSSSRADLVSATSRVVWSRRSSRPRCRSCRVDCCAWSASV